MSASSAKVREKRISLELSDVRLKLEEDIETANQFLKELDESNVERRSFIKGRKIQAEETLLWMRVEYQRISGEQLP